MSQESDPPRLKGWLSSNPDMEWTESAYARLNDVFVEHAPVAKYVSFYSNHSYKAHTLHSYVKDHFSQQDLDAVDFKKIRSLCKDIGCIGKRDPQNYRINSKIQHRWVYKKTSPPPKDENGSLITVRASLKACAIQSSAAEQGDMTVLVRCKWGTSVLEERRDARGWCAAIKSNGGLPKTQQERRRESTGTNSDAISLGSSADGPRWNRGERTQRIAGQISDSGTMDPAFQTRRRSPSPQGKSRQILRFPSTDSLIASTPTDSPTEPKRQCNERSGASPTQRGMEMATKLKVDLPADTTQQQDFYDAFIAGLRETDRSYIQHAIRSLEERQSEVSQGSAGPHHRHKWQT